MPDWITKPSLNGTELGEHLSVSCSKTLNRILAKTGLEPERGRFPWRRIFRAVHGTEAFLLPAHLAELKARYGTPVYEEIEDPAKRAVARRAAQGSPMIDAIDDLEAELRVPLWPFERMAREIGEVPNTLSKKLREGRGTLRFPTLGLGPRLRLYRPLEVRLWREEELLLDLPSAVRVLSETAPDRVAAPDGRAATDAPGSPGDAGKAVFGRFGRSSRKNSA